MNKKDLVKKVADEVGITQAAAKKALAIILDEIARTTDKKDKLKVRGVKKIAVKTSGSPTKRDVRTGRFKVAKVKARSKAKAAKVAASSGRRGGGTGGGGPGIRSKK